MRKRSTLTPNSRAARRLRSEAAQSLVPWTDQAERVRRRRPQVALAEPPHRLAQQPFHGRDGVQAGMALPRGQQRGGHGGIAQPHQAALAQDPEVGDEPLVIRQLRGHA
ncbi:hypothetical protein [Acrocarpospora sp. B8E8]|uniref:hypothetical protein n=1 Tax=Acrocarpospora sp. B8E8 TaxID=3153572 RepID=UPI00325C618D